MPLADPNIWYGRGLWTVLVLLIIVIIFWLWRRSKIPQHQGAY